MFSSMVATTFISFLPVLTSFLLAFPGVLVSAWAYGAGGIVFYGI